MANKSIISRATSTLSGLANKAQASVRQAPLAAQSALGAATSRQDGAEVFGFPVANGKITQQFGVSNLNQGYVSKRNEGTDISGKLGDPITAAYNGTIIGIENNSGAWGNRVIIDYGLDSTGQKRQGAYNHLSGFGDFKVGDKVGANDVIGRLGDSGNTTGPHLDFETTLNGTSVPPAIAFKGFQFDPAWGGSEKGVSNQGYNRSENKFYDLNDLSKSTGSYSPSSGRASSGSSGVGAGASRGSRSLSEAMNSSLGSVAPTSGVTSTKRAGALGLDVNG